MINKNKYLLLLIPLMALSSCNAATEPYKDINKGVEISEEKALEIANEISTNLKDTYPFISSLREEQRYHYKTPEHKETQIITNDLYAESNNRYHTHWTELVYFEKNKDKNEKNIEDHYVVPQEEKDTYIIYDKHGNYYDVREVGDPDGGLTLGSSVRVSDDEEYVRSKFPISQEFYDPLTAINNSKFETNSNLTYYSNGKNNITVKKHIEDSNRNMIFDFQISYSSKGLIGFKQEIKPINGEYIDDTEKTYSLTLFEVTYPDSVKVDLPKDYKEHLNK